jgi:Na+-transporting NADH:ubiquinone oxidoreductase subunit B
MNNNAPPAGRPLVQWQLPMQRMLYAMTPLVLASVYFFGWRALLVLAVTNAAAFLTEWLYLRQYREPVSSAVFVTGTILALSLPPAIPLWIAALGAVFGVLFGKMVFGGFGRNVFNPAMVGRAFIYVSFGNQMTGIWSEALSGFPAGLGRFASDVASGATPVRSLTAPYQDLLFGNVTGSLGETSALLLVAGGLWLVWKKAASWRIVAASLIGFAGLQAIFYFAGIKGNSLTPVDPLYALLSGSVLFGIFFIATDPVSAASTNTGRWLFGLLFGILTVLIRTFSAWPEGTMFAILLANMFAPITDYLIKGRKKAAAA